MEISHEKNLFSSRHCWCSSRYSARYCSRLSKEAGLSYVSISPDAGSSDSALGVDFRYNFETVSTTNRPLSEAGFLGHNGGVNVGYSAEDKADVTSLNVGGDYWFDKIYVAAGLTNIDDGFDKTTAFGIKAGYMLEDGLRVHVGLSNKGVVEGIGANDETTLSLGAKYVVDLGGNFVNLEGEFVNNSDFKLFSVAGDYYLSNELSVGVGLAKSDLDFADKLAVELGAKYFFVPNISGEISYTLNNNGFDKDTALGLRVAARF